MTSPTFTENDFDIVERQVVYDGVFQMVKYHVRYKLFAGGYSKVILREVMERKSAAAILPYDPIQDRVILIEQFRAGAISSGQPPWLFEVVAGVIEDEELPDQVALRESKEEANCEILDLQPLYEYFASPGGCNENIYLFIGRINSQSESGFYGLEAENEDIRTHVLTCDEAFAMLNDNKIKTPHAIISLQWLQLNREKLRTSWLTK